MLLTITINNRYFHNLEINCNLDIFLISRRYIKFKCFKLKILFINYISPCIYIILKLNSHGKLISIRVTSAPYMYICMSYTVDRVLSGY